MKKISNKFVIIFALVLCLSVSIGASLAYFSDYEEASGGATLNLGGKTEISEGTDHDQKNIVITNTGKTNMIVRVAIMGEGVKYFKNPPSYSTNDWVTDTDSNGVTWYYYKKVLEPGEAPDYNSTSPINAKMEFSWEGEEPDYNFDITVVHESAQAVYNGRTLAAPEGWNQSIVKAIPLPETNSGKEGE